MNFSVVVCCFLISALTTPVGIGGGGLFMPLLTIVGGLSSKVAVGLTQILMCGGSIAACIMISKRWRSSLSVSSQNIRTVMKYVHVLLPALLSGTICGVYVSKLLPPVIQMLSLFAVCCYGSYTILNRAIITFKKESEEFSQNSKNIRPEPPASKPMGKWSELEEPRSAGGRLTVGESSLAAAAAAAAEIELQSTQQPKQEPAALKEEELISFAKTVAAYVLATFLLILIKGSKGVPSIIGISSCGSLFWIIVLLQIAILGHIAWTSAEENDRELLVKAWIVGLITRATGAAPGVLANPLMMAYGINPGHVAEISTIITFVTTAVSSVDFILSGLIPFPYMFLSFSTFVGAIFGVHAVSAIVQKTGRPSILIFLLGILALIGAFSVFAAVISGTMHKIRTGDRLLEFEHTCS
jgi:uncharacterized membrane protein YfcA